MLPILYSLAIFEFEFVGFGVSKYVGVSMQSIYVAPVKSKGFAEFWKGIREVQRAVSAFKKLLTDLGKTTLHSHIL